jgi:hypothetical protein
MKKISLISLFILLCSCTSNYKYFTLKENTSIPEGYKIYVGKVNVNLSEEKMSSGASSKIYPDQEALKKIFKDELISSLKQQGLYSNETNNPNVFEANFDINYVRVFMAFTSDKYAASRIEGYQINVTKNENIIATRSNKGRYAANHGLVGNLAKIGKTLSLSADQSDELKEINVFAEAISKDLIKLGK